MKLLTDYKRVKKKHNQSKNQARIEEDAPIQNIRMRLNISYNGQKPHRRTIIGQKYSE
jgi:hypothetical protein